MSPWMRIGTVPAIEEGYRLRELVDGARTLARWGWGALQRLPLARWARCRAVLPLSSRRLLPGDLPAVLALVQSELASQVGTVARQLAGRWQDRGLAVGAFDRSGRLVGFLFLDEYRQEGVEVDGVWVRSLVVRRQARGLGVARSLLVTAHQEALCQGIRQVFADFAPDNTATVRLMSGWGFRECAAAEVERFNQASARAGLGTGWQIRVLDL